MRSLSAAAPIDGRSNDNETVNKVFRLRMTDIDISLLQYHTCCTSGTSGY